MKKCKTYKPWAAVVALALIPMIKLEAAPVVTVQAVQRTGTGLVDIYYDVSHADNAIMIVSVAVSTNNGATYDLSASSFSNGNSNVASIGSAVMPGTGHWIVWMPWPTGRASTARISVSRLQRLILLRLPPTWS